MDFKRFGHILICLILICALVVNISPIRAKAVSWEWSLVTGNPYVIGGAILVSLGVMGLTDEVVFDGVIRQAVTDLGGQVLRAVNAAGETFYYASASLIESFRNWLFDSGTITSTIGVFSAGDTITISNGDSLVVQQTCYHVQFVGTNNGTITFYDYVFSEKSGNLTYYLNGAESISQGVYMSGYRVYRHSQTVSTEAGYPSIGEYGVDYTSSLNNRIISCFEDGTLGITAIDGLTLGEVPLTPITEGARTDILSEWANRQIWVTTPDVFGWQYETEAYYPLYLGDYDELLGLEQEEILGYAGILANPGLEWEDEEEYGTADLLLGETYAEVTLSTATDIVVSDGNLDAIGGYGFDLTEFFPFCIPFDLYEFFSLLAAEPEAPVFEWVIPVPQMNQEFSFTVDLSAWDSVAKLFRTLELLAFIVGLAILTRDKFLRG